MKSSRYHQKKTGEKTGIGTRLSKKLVVTQRKWGYGAPVKFEEPHNQKEKS